MPTTIAGVYHGGRIDLLETPAGVREGRVQVTLSEDQTPPSSERRLPYGKYTAGRLSMPEDFTSAEWHEEAEPNDESVRG